MKIGVAIAAYEPGTTGEYVARALHKLGHEVAILSQWDFYTAFENDVCDLYLCVDSGGPLNLFESSVAMRPMSKVCFWMIDYRRGKELKNPNDLNTCRLIDNNGGWVFQAQYEDMLDCFKQQITRVSWLPLAADPQVWSDEPDRTKQYDVGFVGNVWDNTRQSVLNDLSNRFNLGFKGHGGAVMEAGASVLRQSRLGFNISSFYGTGVDFDVNMRVFETLSCGVPLVTNNVDCLGRIFGRQDFVRTYTSLAGIVPTVSSALKDDVFLASGPKARQWILDFGTYEVRMKQALTTLANNGMIDKKWGTYE